MPSTGKQGSRSPRGNIPKMHSCRTGSVGFAFFSLDETMVATRLKRRGKVGVDGCQGWLTNAFTKCLNKQQEGH